MFRALLRESRPKQWLKNVLVFAAPGAAGVLDQRHELVLTIVTFVAFCFAASGIYFWNDLLDVKADRVHPTKRFRPIASGELSITAARVGRRRAATHRSRPGRAHGTVADRGRDRGCTS